MFNHRRQSRDVKVLEHILNGIGLDRNMKVYMSNYSYTLFKDVPFFNCIVDDYFLNIADETSVCFIEGQDIENYADKITGIILYKWNRVYPADTHFNLDLSNYTLVHTEDFKGKSHDKISEEIYAR
jgi:DNA-binding ferritin-like protein (Dps family)